MYTDTTCRNVYSDIDFKTSQCNLQKGVYLNNPYPGSYKIFLEDSE